MKSDFIQTILNNDIALLLPEREGASAILAFNRLKALADNSHFLMTWLAEPWWANDIENTLIHCARIHLYARILDDALDENLPIHRLTMLRVQKLFWSSVGELAKIYPHLWEESTKLISETIQAVEEDDKNVVPTSWGAKNHHLLLIPLFLSNNSQIWQENKKMLSDVIWLMQTGDELRQNVLKNKAIKIEIINEIKRILSEKIPTVLSQNGWHLMAERMLWESQNLLLNIR
jgi:hypothetical protein